MFAAIESTNIVGYVTDKVASGNRPMRVATFAPIKGSLAEMTIGSVQQNGGDPADIVLATYNDNVTRLREFHFFTKDFIETEELGCKEGWYEPDADGEYDLEKNSNDVALPFGYACVVDGVATDTSFMFSGSVVTTDVEVELSAGQRRMTGNTLPREIDINEIKQVGGDPADLVLATYNDNVTRLCEYHYFTKEFIAAEELGCEEGWYEPDADGEYDLEAGPAHVTIKAGQGFVIDCVAVSATFKLPAAL